VIVMATAEPAAPVRRDLWVLPADAGARFRFGLISALTRRCPYCGNGNIFQNYWVLKHHCPTCGVVFEREDGYFLGGYAFNLVSAEFLGLGLALILIFMTGLRNADFMVQWAVIVALAVLFPVLLFPFSRGAWMALDLTLNPPFNATEKQLRGNLRRYEEPAKKM
jgi:uncharacterized protein (DUF983 family)